MTLLFTDIEGSTEIIEQVGDQRWYRILRDHRALVEHLVRAFDGSVVKSQGDGFMIAFRNAGAALRCAIEMQRTFSSRTSGDVAELKVRIGLHTGVVIADAGDFYGKNVVLAARIADAASGGEILVTSDLKARAETHAPFRFALRGDFALKGLLGRHTAFAVDW